MVVAIVLGIGVDLTFVSMLIGASNNDRLVNHQNHTPYIVLLTGDSCI
jgi:hypothetical protein